MIVIIDFLRLYIELFRRTNVKKVFVYRVILCSNSINIIDIIMTL